jgi:uncharacterized membrane protein YidH (DUF202 family)
MKKNNEARKPIGAVLIILGFLIVFAGVGTSDYDTIVAVSGAGRTPFPEILEIVIFGFVVMLVGMFIFGKEVG